MQQKIISRLDNGKLMSISMEAITCYQPRCWHQKIKC